MLSWARSRDPSSHMLMPGVGVRGSLLSPPGCQAPEHAFYSPPWKSTNDAESQMSAQASAPQGAQLRASVGRAFV